MVGFEILKIAHSLNKSAQVAPASKTYTIDLSKIPVDKAADSLTIGEAIKNIFGSPKLGIISGLAIGGYAIKNSYDKIKNDQKRRAIFETICWDPTFKDIDKSQLLDWYTTIYHYAPDTSLDKVATKELLRQFMTFGKVDIQTLKTIAETQKAVSDARDKDTFKYNLW